MSAPCFKILIDLDEYTKLLTLKEIVKKQEEELKKHYETKTTPTVTKPQLKLKEELQDEFQSGAGPSNDAFSHENRSSTIREIIAEVSKNLTNTFEKQYNLRPISAAIKQDGAGADDLLNTNPLPLDFPDTEFPPVEGVEIKKSRLNDDFDLKSLLDKIPAQSLARAEKLVEVLQDFPSEITWDSNGTIFIDQHSLPESNIFDLFPKLFQKVSHPSKILNLREVATKIASLGYGHLINFRLTSGLNRKKTLLNQDELKLKIKAHPNWWYIGD